MSDEAMRWDEFGGDEPASKLLPAGDYTGEIKVASFGHAEWAERKVPESNGKVLKVKVEIDAPEGYAEAWTTIPAVKSRIWQIRLICVAAGVDAPSKDGPEWSPACLIGKRVSVSTSIYTNERTGESKVQVDKWNPGALAAEQAKQEKPVKATAARTAKQRVEAAGQGGASDDIPF